MKSFFITGTDTDCGKTYATCQLIDHLRQAKAKAIGIKPIASGSIKSDGQLINKDIFHLQKHNSTRKYPINCWQFIPPISPHLAARQTGCHVSVKEIVAFCQQEQYKTLDYLLIEGAGGLMVPLNEEETWLDFLKLIKIPIILVVGMKLGCINHALLTFSVVQQEKLQCAGWIANCLDFNMLALSENIATLSQKLTIPLLATIPFKGNLIPHFKFL